MVVGFELTTRTPDFFIVGQSKSGTTALYEMLAQHPDIFMPTTKEPSYYCSDLLAPDHMWRAPSRDQYLALFAAAGLNQIVGEASPTYIWAPAAAARIAADRPDAKIIVLLRDPARFLLSLHGELLQHEIEVERDLRHALALEATRREGNRVPPTTPRPTALLYSERVRYAEQLERYFATFGRDQVLVLIYEDFRNDNLGTLRTIFSFLGVDPEFVPAHSSANPSLRLRSQATRRLIKWATHGESHLARGARRLVKVALPRSARRTSVATINSRIVYGAPKPADNDLVTELRERFRPDVLQTGRLLARDLDTRWRDAD